DLFMIVAMLGNQDLGIDLDESNRDPVAVDHPSKNTVPDPRRLQLGDRFIDAHVCLLGPYGPHPALPPRGREPTIACAALPQRRREPTIGCAHLLRAWR